MCVGKACTCVGNHSVQEGKVNDIMDAGNWNQPQAGRQALQKTQQRQGLWGRENWGGLPPPQNHTGSLIHAYRVLPRQNAKDHPTKKPNAMLKNLSSFSVFLSSFLLLLPQCTCHRMSVRCQNATPAKTMPCHAMSHQTKTNNNVCQCLTIIQWLSTPSHKQKSTPACPYSNFHMPKCR